MRGLFFLLHCGQFQAVCEKSCLFLKATKIETDSEGYLKDTTQWSEAMAEVIAAQEGITLAVEHWEVVRFVREFYLEFNTSPGDPYAGQGDGQQVWRRERQQPLSLSPVPERTRQTGD